jgi:hypothetical protein
LEIPSITVSLANYLPQTTRDLKEVNWKKAQLDEIMDLR